MHAHEIHRLSGQMHVILQELLHIKLGIRQVLAMRYY